MDKKRLTIFVLSICLSLPVFAFAETIVLKSGKTVEGKIMEKTDKYIKIDFEGVPLTYFFDEIKSIDGNKISISPAEENIDKNVLDNNDTEWYINDDFGFRIKKLPGWEFKEHKSVEKGIPMLFLYFEKLSQNVNFRNILIFNISKINKSYSPLRQGPLAKGAEFISFADNVIDSATKNFNKLSFAKETISINNVNAREARFEYVDKNGNFTNRLMYFEPVEIKSDIISVLVIFKCKSEEYPTIDSVLDNSLMSIEFGQ